MAHYFLSRMKAYVSQRFHVVKGKTIKDTKYSFCFSLWVASLWRYSIVWHSHCSSSNNGNVAALMWTYLTAPGDLGFAWNHKCDVLQTRSGWILNVWNICKILIFCWCYESMLVSRVNWKAVKHQSFGLVLDFTTGLFFSRRCCFCSRCLLVRWIILCNFIKPQTDRAVA